MDKYAIIFGATGQDGYYLSKLLLDKGYVVLAVKRRASTDNETRISSFAKNPKYKIVEGDVSDMVSVMSVFKKLIAMFPRYYVSDVEVYNLAAQSHVHTSFEQPSYTFDVNTKGVLNILECIRMFNTTGEDNIDANILTFKFYQASTSEMFGSKVSHKAGINEYHTDVSEIINKKYVGIKLSDAYQSENTPFVPMSPYAVSKLAAHQLVNNYRKAYGIHASCGILFNHESRMRGDNFVTKKITNFLREFEQILYFRQELNTGENLPTLELGNLSSYRDFGYAEDYVEAMWLMLQQKQPDDYVIATGKSIAIHEFLNMAIDVSGLDKNIVMPYISLSNHLVRPSEVDYLRGDASKAKKQLGWQPKTDLRQLIHKMLHNND